jgi:multiple sugar transport system permease protein
MVDTEIANSRRHQNAVIKGAIYVFLLLGAVSIAIPYVWMFVTSFKPVEEIQSYPPSFLIKHPTMQPYRDLFRLIPILKYIWNSLYVSATVTIANLFFCSLAGYAFAKHRFWGRDKIFFALLGSLMIPWQVNLISGFVLMIKFGWLNSFNALIIPAMAGAFGIFLCRQFIMSIPDDLIDAARMDGCSEFTIYRLVILPLIKPILATLAIFTFLQQWNNFIWPLIVINSSEMRTLPLALSVLNSQFGTRFGMIMAGAVVATTPMLVIFLAFQKYFMKGITIAGLKEYGTP